MIDTITILDMYINMPDKLSDNIINIILNVIKVKCPNKKKVKFTDAEYLTDIELMLTDLRKWESIMIKYGNTRNKYYYKTVHKKFIKWSRLGIFEEAYKQILKEYVTSAHTYNTTIDLFIDATCIYNKHGSELVAYGSENRKKQITKISYVADDQKIVYDMSIFAGNTVEVNTIQHVTDNLKESMKYRNINLTGDKGYISANHKKTLKDNKNISLHYPNKSNMKNTGKIAKKHLTKRYTIENTISDHKRFDRISLRKDKLLVTFKSFCYIALTINLRKKHKRYIIV